jgi:hypothetical protein
LGWRNSKQKKNNDVRNQSKSSNDLQGTSKTKKAARERANVARAETKSKHLKEKYDAATVSTRKEHNEPPQTKMIIPSFFLKGDDEPILID